MQLKIQSSIGDNELKKKYIYIYIYFLWKWPIKILTDRGHLSYSFRSHWSAREDYGVGNVERKWVYRF